MHDDLAPQRRSRRSPLALGLALLLALVWAGPSATTASASAESGRVVLEASPFMADSVLARQPAARPARRRHLRRLERVARVFDPLWRRVASRAPLGRRTPPRELSPPPSADALPASLRGPPAT